MMKKLFTLITLTIVFIGNAQITTTGATNSATNASAIGFNTTASNIVSTAMGRETLASGQTSTAIGPPGWDD